MIELNKGLSKREFVDVVLGKERVQIDEQLTHKIEECHSFLVDFSANKIIYGVNTGFGPMAQYRVSEEDRRQLQLNLVRSHASGTGRVMPVEHTRATMLARLNSICQAKSGVHKSVVEVLTTLINKEIYPIIFEHGGVGASGDLVQLSHLALALIGEGEVMFKGERRPTAIVFKEEGVQPIQIKIREGLSLINGTSAMTGIGLLNHYKAEKLLGWSVKMATLINELVEAYDDHFSEELNSVKNHSGQQIIAKMMREHVEGSKLIQKREHDLYSGKKKEKIFEKKVQEYYSIRCIPQILGPIYDTLKYTGKVVENELNSANDNPIIDCDIKQVYHGGNFHGDYISLEMDKLKLAVTRMTMLAERQLNFLLNHKINGILPPFVTRGKLGLNYGIQGMQFTATSTTAENQTLSNPMYVHSIPNNNDNQDIVSMGTNAAQITATTIENAFQVFSIELIAITQAVRHLGIKEKLSHTSSTILNELELVVPDIIEDPVAYPLIEKTINYLKGTK